MTNVNDSLDGAYLEWLYSQVGIVQNRNPARSHWKLLKQLYTREFTWYVPNDDNRIEDGKELRSEFLQDTGFVLDDPLNLWFDLGCSMLEMLIGLARRVAFESDRSPDEWFWRLMHNLELEKYTDDVFEISIEETVEDVLDTVIHRQYSYDGTGGLFPLRDAHQDQRTVEVWYQLQAYLLEGLYVTQSPRF